MDNENVSTSIFFFYQFLPMIDNLLSLNESSGFV